MPMTQLRQTHGLNNDDPDKIPSMDEKIQLSYDLFKIGMMVLKVTSLDGVRGMACGTGGDEIIVKNRNVWTW